MASGLSRNFPKQDMPEACCGTACVCSTRPTLGKPSGMPQTAMPRHRLAFSGGIVPIPARVAHLLLMVYHCFSKVCLNFFFFLIVFFFFFFCINQTQSFYWKKIVGKAANRDIKPKMTSSDTHKRWCLSSPKSNWLAFWNDAKDGQRALFKRSLWRFQSFFQFYSQGMIPINISMNMWRS